MATTTPFPTLNVIPNGFRWSPEAAQKAAAKGSFLRVGGQQVTKRYLSGAQRSWRSADPAENQTVFHTGFRITGTPENIRTALTYANIPADQINAVLNSVITRDNYNTTMAADVEKELNLREGLKQAKPVVQGYEWPQIIWLAQNLKSATIMSKTGGQKGAVASPGRAGTGETLGQKIQKLGAGKVLDVSNMDINTGKGVRTVNAPKTAKSGKFGTVGRVPIISNNLEKYIRAIQLAYGPEGENVYRQDIDAVRQALSNAGAPAVMAAVPTPGRVPSPTRTNVPGATLAAPPVFTAATGAVPRVPSPTRVGAVGGGNLPNIPALGTLLRQ